MLKNPWGLLQGAILKGKTWNILGCVDVDAASNSCQPSTEQQI